MAQAVITKRLDAPPANRPHQPAAERARPRWQRLARVVSHAARGPGTAQLVRQMFLNDLVCPYWWVSCARSGPAYYCQGDQHR